MPKHVTGPPFSSTGQVTDPPSSYTEQVTAPTSSYAEQVTAPPSSSTEQVTDPPSSSTEQKGGEAVLPDGWTLAWSKTKQRQYCFNNTTGTSVWEDGDISARKEQEKSGKRTKFDKDGEKNTLLDTSVASLPVHVVSPQPETSQSEIGTTSGEKEPAETPPPPPPPPPPPDETAMDRKKNKLSEEMPNVSRSAKRQKRESSTASVGSSAATSPSASSAAAHQSKTRSSSTSEPGNSRRDRGESSSRTRSRTSHTATSSESKEKSSGEFRRNRECKRNPNYSEKPLEKTSSASQHGDRTRGKTGIEHGDRTRGKAGSEHLDRPRRQTGSKHVPREHTGREHGDRTRGKAGREHVERSRRQSESKHVPRETTGREHVDMTRGKTGNEHGDRKRGHAVSEHVGRSREKSGSEHVTVSSGPKLYKDKHLDQRKRAESQTTLQVAKTIKKNKTHPKKTADLKKAAEAALGGKKSGIQEILENQQPPSVEQSSHKDSSANLRIEFKIPKRSIPAVTPEKRDEYQQPNHIKTRKSGQEVRSSESQPPAVDYEEEAMDWQDAEAVLEITNSLRYSTDSQFGPEGVTGPQPSSHGAPRSSAPLSPASSVAVVDTNIFISNLRLCQEVISRGDGTVLAVPWMVLQELDKLKAVKEKDVVQGARQAVRWLEEAAKINQAGITFQQVSDGKPADWVSCADDQILEYCLRLQARVAQLGLLTNDRNLATKAMANQVKTMSAKEAMDQLNGNKVDSGGGSNQPPTTSRRPVRVSQPVTVIGDEHFVGVKGLGLELLEELLVQEMESVYNSSWKQIVKVTPRETKPYWSTADLFAAYEKHRIAVFSINFPKNPSKFRNLISTLQSLLSGERGSSREVLHQLASVCRMVLERESQVSRSLAESCLTQIEYWKEKVERRPSVDMTPVDTPITAAVDSSTSSNAPTTLYTVPTPVLQCPTPVLQCPTPVLQCPAPVLQCPTPVLQWPTSGLHDTGPVLTLLNHIWLIICVVTRGLCGALNVPWAGDSPTPLYTFSVEEALHYTAPFSSIINTINGCYSQVIRHDADTDSDQYKQNLIQLGQILSQFKENLQIRDDPHWRDTPTITLSQLQSFVSVERAAIIGGYEQLQQFRGHLAACMETVRQLMQQK